MDVGGPSLCVVSGERAVITEERRLTGCLTILDDNARFDINDVEAVRIRSANSSSLDRGLQIAADLSVREADAFVNATVDARTGCCRASTDAIARLRQR